MADTVRRQTLKAIRQYKDETGESDFTQSESLFHFSDRNLSNLTGLTVPVIREAVQEIGLPSTTRRDVFYTWLPDLSDRLIKAIEN